MVALNGRRRDAVVAVDAMGGDYAPDEIVKGAIAAAGQGVNAVLVGPEPELRRRLREIGGHLPTRNAPGVIAMDEPVAHAMRRDDSSLRIAMDLVATQEADAVVSCGNSAAIMAVATHALGRQPGIERPAFGGSMPARNGGSIFILDIGANSTVKASNLVQFAVMGDVYAKTYKGIGSPRVALLSNGSEDSKGTKPIKEANEALRKLDLNFVGNVEGNQIFEGNVDVVVCDGFSGNVLLKTAEGAAGEIFYLLKREIERDLVARVASAALMPTFQRIRRQVDFQEIGGALVLGVNGVVINCHGRSRAKAVCNAILQAERMAREHLVERIVGELHEEDVESGRRKRRLARAFHLRSTNP